MLHRVGDESMSTALATALRESCGYLRDAGYRETARLLVAAADEIEALRRRLQALEHPSHEHPSQKTHGSAHKPPSNCLVERGIGSDSGALPPSRRTIGANR